MGPFVAVAVVAGNVCAWWWGYWRGRRVERRLWLLYRAPTTLLRPARPGIERRRGIHR